MNIIYAHNIIGTNNIIIIYSNLINYNNYLMNYHYPQMPFAHSCLVPPSLLSRRKGGGIHPIAIGCTIRRLASKCACLHALKSIPDVLSPHQVGFGVSGGAEAAVHASRVYLNHMHLHQSHPISRFNAFNCIRRDKSHQRVHPRPTTIYSHSMHTLPHQFC